MSEDGKHLILDYASANRLSVQFNIRCWREWWPHHFWSCLSMPDAQYLTRFRGIHIRLFSIPVWKKWKFLSLHVSAYIQPIQNVNTIASFFHNRFVRYLQHKDAPSRNHLVRQLPQHHRNSWYLSGVKTVSRRATGLLVIGATTRTAAFSEHGAASVANTTSSGHE